MKSCLVIQGGYRIGDTTHLIPLFNKLSQDYEITWVTGDYEKEIAEFLASVKSLNIKKLIVQKEWRKPGDLSDREKFINQVLPLGKEGAGIVNPKDYDKVVTDIRCSFEIAYRYPDYLGNYPELTYLNLTEIERKSLDYICVQPDSISKQKSLKWLVDLQYPYRVVSLGKKDELLVHRAEDKRGVLLRESIKYLFQSKYNVCIHSSLACISFYLNKPTIVCHFFDGQFRFGDFHSNCIDLVCPSKEELNKWLEKLK